MKRTIIASLAIFAAWWGVGANLAFAQFGTLGQQPRLNPGVTSPLFPRTNTAVVPFNPARSADWFISQRLSQDGTLLGQSGQTSGSTQTVFQTGHTVTFLDYAGYFPLSVPNSSGPTLGSQYQYPGTLGSQLQGLGSQGHLPNSLIGTGATIGFQRR